jgi:hypothetical protein
MPFRLSLLVFLFPMILPGQQDYFQTGYGGSGTEKFNDIEAVPSGGFLATGYTSSFGAGGFDVLLIRLDNNADLLWSKTIGFAGDDFANCMTVLNDGSILIAGTTESFTSAAQPIAFASRLDSSGNVLWFETFRDSIAHYFNDIIVRPDNSIMLGGMTFFAQSQTIECSSLLTIDMNGNVLWSKKFTAPSALTQTTSLCVLPGGSVIVAGKHCPGSNPAINGNGYLMRITPAGTVGWSKAVNTVDADLFYDVCYAGGMDCAAVGATNSAGAGDYDVMLTLFDTAGVHRKSITYGTTQIDYGHSIISCADGGFAIIGITEDAWAPGQFDPFVLRTDSLGNQLWLKVLGTPYPDVLNAGNIAMNGNFIMCGSTQGLGTINNESAYIALSDSAGQTDCNSIPFQFQSDSIMSYTNVTATFIAFAYTVDYRSVGSQLVPAMETYPLCITGVSDAEWMIPLLVYPQPANTHITITGIPKNTHEICIYNLTGELVYHDSPCTDKSYIELNVRGWGSGLYFISTSNDSVTVTGKFIINAE